MTKIYLIITVCGLLGATYFLGLSNGSHKCQQQFAQTHINTIKQQHIITEEINAKTYHTGMRDIRRILREKYTIAE
ncbi:MAG: hypothetical protein MJ164_03975 [Alphaproteobacteria bacterium]|nr:hypothetical protein [Alphaproteobacteria bacterium]